MYIPNKKIVLMFFIIFLFFFILEFLLRITGYALFEKKQSNKPLEIIDEEAIRIMLIGDSWTLGFDASEGNGYVDILKRLLADRFPKTKIQFFNYAFPSSNSSQCLYQFLDHYKICKPHILIALIGINNCWNTMDVDRVKKRISFVLNIENKPQPSKIWEIILNSFNKLRIIRLAKIAYYNFFESKNENKKYMAIMGNSSYVNKTHNLISTEGQEAAREYLVSNIKEARNYEQFFNLIVYTLGSDLDKAKEYLIKKNLYKPNLLKQNYDLVFKNQKKYVVLAKEILLMHLDYLRFFCKKEGIILVLQTYPFFRYFDNYNYGIRELCQRHKIFCVDHAQYLLDKFNIETHEALFNKAHPNDRGHLFMANNLFNFFIDNKIIDSAEQTIHNN